MDLYRLDRIYNFSAAPEDKEGFSAWVKQDDVVEFLVNDICGDNIILYASMLGTLLHTVLVPLSSLQPANTDDLREWDQTPDSGWSVWSGGDKPKPWIEPPLSSSSSATLKEGEQILFVRSFDGVKNMNNYIEIAEKLTQVLGLHYMRERKAWCKLDDNGDIDDIIKIHTLEFKGEKDWGRIVFIRNKALAEYCSLTDAALVRMFDIDRIDYSHFTSWDGGVESEIADKGVYGKRVVISGEASYFRGVQVYKLEYKEDDGRQKQYASFIAHDWKNKVVKEISCSPEAIDSYFIESKKPFELSPVFFRPEVLLKYKSDTDKYRLNNRSISCRGSWHLQTYDINDAGQVHTYLIYLSRLPYEEQLHWKQYNERPKAPLSERAITSDFGGKYYDGYYPLDSLKRKMTGIRDSSVPWWKMRSEDSMNSLHPVVTNSVDEWKEEILKLDQVLVGGFVEKALKNKAEQLGRTLSPKLRSIGLIEECLIGLGFEPEHAKEISEPLRTTHHLRSVLKGHVAGETAETIRRDAITVFDSYGKHFDALCSRCDDSMGVIIEALSKNE